RVVPAGGTKLCDKHIPAGTIVGINASVIHRDTNIFGADTDEFRPERWLNKDVETIKSMDRYLLTFGTGTRSCIGENISIVETGKLIPQVIRDFDLEWASEKPTWEV
ncbi:CypX, Cytochrome P450, partial [Pyrenophora tritici-repentis]